MERLHDLLGPPGACPLTASWPLYERDSRFDLGFDCAWDEKEALRLSEEHHALARSGIGVWDCDLADNRLTWSDGVYDIFGLPRGVTASRDTAVSLYEEGSRAAMERLRAYAIQHRRGFTLDVDIHPAGGGRRRVRLIAALICSPLRPARLRGVKIDLTKG